MEATVQRMRDLRRRGDVLTTGATLGMKLGRDHRGFRFRRVVSGLWLVLYAVVAVALPVADAAATHAPVAAHWEDASDTSCPPQHDASACQVCQSASAFGRVPANGPALPAAEPVEQFVALDDITTAARAPSRGEPASRAPPRT